MNITTFTITDPLTNISVDWVQIETAPNEFTSMTKETYDAQQATLAANSAPQG